MLIQAMLPVDTAATPDTVAMRGGDGSLSAAGAGFSGPGSSLTGLTKTQVGLGNVDNTSDANKPVSDATQTALNLKANAANAALTGSPSSTTPGGSDDSTRIATTAFVQSVAAAAASAAVAALTAMS